MRKIMFFLMTGILTLSLVAIVGTREDKAGAHEGHEKIAREKEMRGNDNILLTRDAGLDGKRDESELRQGADDRVLARGNENIEKVQEERQVEAELNG